MAVNLIVAVTDRDWFDHLRGRPDLAEVNFWSPSASSFKALQPGELFLFKLHSPDNFIVGGGVFAHANELPCSLSWEAFGEANGARTLAEMRTRIIRYRHADQRDRDDFKIGCRILTQPFFLEEQDWIPVPKSWSPNIVKFKTYSTAEPDGAALWEAIQRRDVWQRTRGFAEDSAGGSARYGEPSIVRPRLGQGAFRVVVTDIYDRRCAVTGERTLPALDAAHIKPFASGGLHERSNGLLLRRDLHKLFDDGYVTVDHDNLALVVSKKIKEEFENGRHYYALHGTRIATPKEPAWHPDKASLQWHNETCFRY